MSLLHVALFWHGFDKHSSISEIIFNRLNLWKFCTMMRFVIRTNVEQSENPLRTCITERSSVAVSTCACESVDDVSACGTVLTRAWLTRCSNFLNIRSWRCLSKHPLLDLVITINTNDPTLNKTTLFLKQTFTSNAKLWCVFLWNYRTNPLSSFVRWILPHSCMRSHWQRRRTFRHSGTD